MELFDDLKKRNAIAQLTNEEQIKELINNGNATFYIGFDATADSLHIGHLLQIMIIKHMQKTGNKPIILLGTGTTLIGDPTGKTDMRKMINKKEIDYNADCFKEQIEKFIGNVTFVRNGDWLCELKYIELMKDIGVHFSVNKMLTAECFKTRLEHGLSFIEFNYMIMQSYDFLYLNRKYNCLIELGGNDQWANILGGVELVRRTEHKEVYGITFTLLTTGEGKKMGKTENGTLWLNESKTPVYDFFQYFRNTNDVDVFKYLKLMTMVPIEEIERLEAEHQDINEVKNMLAFEITKIVHGEEKAKVASNTAKAIFSGNMSSETMPRLILKDTDFDENGYVEVTDILMMINITKSKSEGKRLIEQNAILLDGKKLTNINEKINKLQLKNNKIIIQKGKKTFYKLYLSE